MILTNCTVRINSFYCHGLTADVLWYLGYVLWIQTVHWDWGIHLQSRNINFNTKKEEEKNKESLILYLTAGGLWSTKSTDQLSQLNMWEDVNWSTASINCITLNFYFSSWKLNDFESPNTEALTPKIIFTTSCCANTSVCHNKTAVTSVLPHCWSRLDGIKPWIQNIPKENAQLRVPSYFLVWVTMPPSSHITVSSEINGRPCWKHSRR